MRDVVSEAKGKAARIAFHEYGGKEMSLSYYRTFFSSAMQFEISYSLRSIFRVFAVNRECKRKKKLVIRNRSMFLLLGLKLAILRHFLISILIPLP